MSYLIILEGFKDVAEKFSEEAKIEPQCSIDGIENRIKIRDFVASGKIEDARTLIQQLYPELLDEDRYLLFRVQQQQLIELIRQDNIEDAINFAENQMAERGEDDPEVRDELERTMALMAFRDPTSSPFKELLTNKQRENVKLAWFIFRSLGKLIWPYSGQNSIPRTRNWLPF